ncbi:MAG: hypothetical protein QM811_27435 [Pirellulales bacterium]
MRAVPTGGHLIPQAWLPGGLRLIEDAPLPRRTVRAPATWVGWPLASKIDGVPPGG